MTGHIAHYAAKSLIFPLPPPGSPDHKPIAWDAAQPYRGIGWREIESEMKTASYDIHEHLVSGT